MDNCRDVILPHVLLLSRPVAPPAGSLVEDIGEMILQLRRQVENLFSIKFGTFTPQLDPPSGSDEQKSKNTVKMSSAD